MRLPALNSVRVRTTLAATLVVGLALALGGWLLLVTLQRSLTHRDDVVARGWARDLAAQSAAGSLPVVIPPHGDDDVGQVVDGHGNVVAATRNVARLPRLLGLTPSGAEPEVRTVPDVPDDREREAYRVWALAASSEDGPVTVYVGTSIESVHETVVTLRRLLVRGLPVAVLVVFVGAWFTVGRALRPVESLRSQVAGLTQANLHQRVPEPGTGDEIARLARTMNDMLGRLEASSVRQRAFVADASHELQSPLTRLRTQLEVALANPASTHWPTLARELLEDGAEMERLVRDLLFLARQDESQGQERPRDLVDLDGVVLEEVARLRVGARRVVDTSAVSAAAVRGNREDLVRLVRNLLENAERHAAERVEVSLSNGNGTVSLVVADDGPGIAAEDRTRIFDRFVRLDDARTRDSGGSGLGLAIVASVAARHGGSASVTDSTGGARFVVRLPAATPS